MIDNRKRWRFAFWMTLMSLGVAGSAAAVTIGMERFPITEDEQKACYVKNCTQGGGGDHFPWPFESSNRRVELADGEPYTLKGLVMLAPEAPGSQGKVPYLYVDLNEHPWLANSRRKEDPKYPLLGPISKWRPFVGKWINLNCIAHASIDLTENGSLIPLVTLEAQGQNPVQVLDEPSSVPPQKR